uniref:Uncharacterized protein n=1 Tax=Syphacia muris TaxID=451379 RepID=A0A0N5ADJ6_9BILA
MLKVRLKNSERQGEEVSLALCEQRAKNRSSTNIIVTIFNSHLSSTLLLLLTVKQITSVPSSSYSVYVCAENRLAVDQL